jgi:hypothetical protein
MKATTIPAMMGNIPTTKPGTPSESLTKTVRTINRLETNAAIPRPPSSHGRK